MSSGGLKSVVIQPICDLNIVPPLFTILAYRFIQELLVLRIGCNPEIGETTSNFEGKKDVGSVILRGFLATVQIYSTVTDLARLRGLSTSVPLIKAA